MVTDKITVGLSSSLGVIRTPLPVCIYRERAEQHDRIRLTAAPLHNLYPLLVFPTTKPYLDLVTRRLNLVAKLEMVDILHRLAEGPPIRGMAAVDHNAVRLYVGLPIEGYDMREDGVALVRDVCLHSETVPYSKTA